MHYLRLWRRGTAAAVDKATGEDDGRVGAVPKPTCLDVLRLARPSPPVS